MAEVYSQELCKKSYSEMAKFAAFANSVGEVPLLFGGWAVYYYNSYAGSKDVDFVVRDENFDALVDFLVREGFQQRELRLARENVFFDLYKKSEEMGEAPARLVLGSLYAGAEKVFLKGYCSVPSRIQVLVPSKPALFFSKLCGLASRSVAKDRSDAIALLLKFDEKDLQAAADMLSPFLKQRLATLRNDSASLSLVASPTKRRLNDLNKRIKTLLLQKPAKPITKNAE